MIVVVLLLVANPRKDPLRSEELRKWINTINNLTSRSRDPVETIEFWHHRRVEGLLDAECMLQVLKEVEDEIQSAKEDFLRMAVDLCKPDV